MARVFTISRSYTRFAVVVYSSRSTKIFGFNRYTNRRSLLRAIGRIRYTGGGTKTGYALSYTYQRVLRFSRRKTKVLVVMTDGRSYDNVKRPAKILRRRGIRILSFGVGKRYSMKQLLQMSSSRRDVFTADFRNLGSVVRLIKRKACKGKSNLISFPLFLSQFDWFSPNCGFQIFKFGRALKKHVLSTFKRVL